MLRLAAAAAVGAGLTLVAVHVCSQKASARRTERKDITFKPKQNKKPKPAPVSSVSRGRNESTLPKIGSRPSSADNDVGPCQCSTAIKELTKFDTDAHVQCLEEHYPRCLPEPVLIDLMTDVLAEHGFTPATAINLVSNCRDEICRPFTEYLDEKWGAPSFNISSLAGMVFCGRTGWLALVLSTSNTGALSHTPVACVRPDSHPLTRLSHCLSFFFFLDQASKQQWLTRRWLTAKSATSSGSHLTRP